ncbi:MAG: hypothetical protein H7Y86_13525 [Rhizobacter sp.]|nr:hypothetical protein [Ferruginibacter sp.]
MKNYLLLILFLVPAISVSAQNISINATGTAPDTSSMLDISSTNTGLLIPRMTSAQRDSIILPANALQIYNTTTKSLNIYNNSRWESISSKASTNNLVNVYSLSDLPAPVSSAITLDATKMYIFSGIVDISPNYLSLNGAGLRGMDPAKDGVMSSVSGGVLRSTAVSVFIESLAVIPLSATTKAYDFADATGTKFCNLFSGCSVVEVGIPSLGVGQISGFKAITIVKNYWNCKDGVKVTGTVGKFASTLNFITGITAGSAIEFLAGITIDDIDLGNNYFIYTGQTGVKVNSGAVIDRGIMTSNMFRGVSTLLTGFDSYTPGWQMVSNTNIPNSRAFAFLYMTANSTSTSLPVSNTYYKIAGTTTTVNAKKFSTTSNKITYTGKTPIIGKVFVIVGAKAPANNSDFSIVIAKNGVIIAAPIGSIAASSNNQSFQITFISELDMSTNDYVEVFIKSNNANASAITVEEMQFRISE